MPLFVSRQTVPFQGYIVGQRCAKLESRGQDSHVEYAFSCLGPADVNFVTSFGSGRRSHQDLFGHDFLLAFFVKEAERYRQIRVGPRFVRGVKVGLLGLEACRSD